MGASFFYPDAPHTASSKVAKAFAKGARAQGLEWFAKPYSGTIEDVNTTYGILYGGTEMIRQCEAEKKDYFYIDHGYFGRSKSIIGMEGYYRVVHNGLQHTSFGGVGGAPAVSGSGESRLRAIGTTLVPRRDPAVGEVIVLIPPSSHQEHFYRAQGLRISEWIAAWELHCRKTYCRPVIISRKGDETPLTKLLDKASYVIGFNSTGLIEAAARGIMVESTGPSPLFWLKPFYSRSQWEDVRHALFCEMALRQFTMEEMTSGYAHNMLREIGEFCYE